MKQFDFSSVKTIGRTCLIDGALWCAFSGTGAAFEFEGRLLSVSLFADGAAEIENNEENYARAAIYVNGRRVVDTQLKNKAQTFDVIKSITPIKASVLIIKLSECAMSTLGIGQLLTDDSADITPAPDKPHRIEFIGDSITCGYGMDDENELHHFKTATEDCTGAYAYKTAQALDADYSLVSVSGYGIISGYTATGEEKIPEQTVPQYYKTLGFSYNKFADKTAPQDIKWDFSRFVPEAIVINLGTNDDSYCLDDTERQRDYTDNYKRFLNTVRGENKDAFIFCTVGIMGTRIYKALETAVNEYKKETGDDRVISFCFDEQDHEHDGYTADYHPTARTHDKASSALVPVIKEYMKW